MKSERGFTLIELMVAGMLSVVVLILVGGMLINSMKAERVVRDATSASNAGQLVATSITRGVRNSSALNLSAPVPGAQLLLARVSGTSADASAFVCQAWYFAGDEIRMTVSPTAIVPPTPAQLATWTLVADGVVQVSGSPVFTLNGKQLDLKLNASAGDGAPVLISTSAVSRQPTSAPADAPVCF